MISAIVGTNWVIRMWPGSITWPPAKRTIEQISERSRPLLRATIDEAVFSISPMLSVASGRDRPAVCLNYRYVSWLLRLAPARGTTAANLLTPSARRHMDSVLGAV